MNCISSVHITARIASIFVSSTAVQINDFHIFAVNYSPLWEFIWNQHNDQLSVGLLASVGRVLHRYHKGHGFKSRTGLSFFFQALFSPLRNVHNCQDRFHIRFWLYSDTSLTRHRLHTYFSSYVARSFIKNSQVHQFSNLFICVFLISSVSYCVADPTFPKVFAFICRSQGKQDLTCHAFLCSKPAMV